MKRLEPARHQSKPTRNPSELRDSVWFLMVLVGFLVVSDLLLVCSRQLWLFQVLSLRSFIWYWFRLRFHMSGLQLEKLIIPDTAKFLQLKKYYGTFSGSTCNYLQHWKLLDCQIDWKIIKINFNVKLNFKLFICYDIHFSNNHRSNIDTT